SHGHPDDSMRARLRGLAFEAIDGRSPRLSERLFVVRVDEGIAPDLRPEASAPSRPNDLKANCAYDNACWLESCTEDRKQATEAREAHRSACSNARRTSVFRVASW